MAIADVAIIVIVALWALFGLLRGTAKSSISLLAWAGSLVAAVLVTRYVAYALLDVPFVHSLVFGTNGFSLYGLVAPHTTNITADGIMGKIFTPLLEPIAANFGGAQMDAAGAIMVAYAIYSAVICVAAFFAARIVMMIITFILKKIFIREGKPGSLSRLLGFVINGANGAAFAVTLFVFAAFAAVFPFAGIVTGEIDKSFIAKPMFEFIAPYTSQMIAGESEMEGHIKDIVQKSGVLDSIEEEYTATFESNGGSDVLSQTRTEGGLVTEPIAPEKEGYIFDGWYYENDSFDTPVVFPYTMQDYNIRFYAKWVPESAQVYTVTFETNGAAETIDPMSDYEGSNISMPSVTKEDMVFDGWYYDDGVWEDPVGTKLELSGNVTVYARWISQEAASVAMLLKGEGSILYTISGVDADGFDAVYWHDALAQGQEDAIQTHAYLSLLLNNLAHNVGELDTAELATLQSKLEVGGSFYDALEEYLLCLSNLVAELNANGGVVDDIDAGTLQDMTLAGGVFTSEYTAIYTEYGW